VVRLIENGDDTGFGGKSPAALTMLDHGLKATYPHVEPLTAILTNIAPRTSKVVHSHCSDERGEAMRCA
jgi:hypothetical protein